MLATQSASFTPDRSIPLRRAVRRIEALTDENAHTEAVRVGLSFLLANALPSGSDKTMTMAKVKALRALHAQHVERGYILPEEVLYRNAAGAWLDAMAEKYLPTPEANTLTGAY